MLRSQTVKDVMTWGMVSVKPDTLLREAASVIHANKIGAVPVVEHDRVVGMLAVGDVLKAVIQIAGRRRDFPARPLGRRSLKERKP